MAKTIQAQIADLKEERSQLIVKATEGYSTPEDTEEAIFKAQASEEYRKIDAQIAELREKQAQNN